MAAFRPTVKSPMKLSFELNQRTTPTGHQLVVNSLTFWWLQKQILLENNRTICVNEKRFKRLNEKLLTFFPKYTSRTKNIGNVKFVRRFRAYFSLRKSNDIGRRGTASFSPDKNRRKHNRDKPA